MGETKQIDVAEASEGFGCPDTPGATVSLPVVELLTGRGFVTGKSGSGKSNSASVVAEKLLDNGFGLLIVDIDGEYYGLKEAYEILHVGGDSECDIQITADHSDKLAALALEQNVPIILDVSSYLDESEAEEILTAVARSLFAKAKKQKQPFLLLVEEVHEYIPENGSVGECGQMLIKIGKRGRKHGLGICGISQRPADVKKDFITQCDWLLWHRLTWNNDTKVVRRILDADYADAVEGLDDGEGFLMTDWADTVRRVQFFRKSTFDAGATPGLEDFERPDLKSVSDDLVSELQEISEERQKRDDRIVELREELDKKNSRIAELERELQDARDLSRMANQFVEAMTAELRGPQVGIPERERMQATSSLSTPRPSREQTTHGDEEWSGQTDTSGAKSESSGTSSSRSNGTEAQIPAFGALAGVGSNGDSSDQSTVEGNAGELGGLEGAGSDTNSATQDTGFATSEAASATNDVASATKDASSAANNAEATEEDGEEWSWSTPGGQYPVSTFSAAAIEEALKAARTLTIEDVRRENAEDISIREQIERSKAGESRFVSRNSSESPAQPSANDASGTGRKSESTEGSRDEGNNQLSPADIVSERELGSGDSTDTDDSGGVDGFRRSTDDGEEPATVRELTAEIADYPRQTRDMLAYYRKEGPDTALNAHFSAGGHGSRTEAYAHNRRLRTRGLIDHVGRGKYGYKLRELLAAELPDSFDDETIDEYASRIEARLLAS